MINKKHVVAVDLILVVGSLLVIFFLIGYARPLVIAPIDDLTTTNTSVLFEFEKAEMILIDDNLQFISPLEIHAEDNLVINLKPGVYYWKVVGALESDVRQLTIESEVGLKLRETDEEGVFEVVNAGNTKLSVDVYEKGVLSGNVIVDVDDSREVSGTKFVGGQNE